MTEPEPEPGSAEALRRAQQAAREHTRAAIIAQVRATARGSSSRPRLTSGTNVPVRDARPVDGMRAGRAIELATRHVVGEYIRHARHDGLGWHEIGGILGLAAEAVYGHATVADAAFDYAAGPDAGFCARVYGRSFTWQCPACAGTISDRGPADSPADGERGHVPTCRRLAAAVTAWESQW